MPYGRGGRGRRRSRIRISWRAVSAASATAASSQYSLTEIEGSSKNDRERLGDQAAVLRRTGHGGRTVTSEVVRYALEASVDLLDDMKSCKLVACRPYFPIPVGT